MVLIGLIAFCLGSCSRAADRTLTIFQFQSTDTYTGQFKIDTSQLPPAAIKERVDSGSEGVPVTKLTIDMKYPIRVALVPEEKK
jgi:hypothetical protein